MTAVAAWLRVGLNGMYGVAPSLPSGFYNGPVCADPSQTLVTVQNTLYASPFLVSTTAKGVDRIVAEVTTLAASSTLRLGVYEALGTGLPGALVFDAGTVASDTTGVKSITLTSKSLPMGLVWLVCVAQGGTPTVRACQSHDAVVPTASADVTTRRAGLTKTGVTGALPATFGTPTATAASVPAMLVRAV